MKRICIVARETCLSQGDIIRLTRDIIDRKHRVIVPEGGRVKTGVKQTAPLTDVVLEVLDEIEKDKKRGSMVSNIEGLVFTRADGRAIDKDMITGGIKRARKKAGVKDFRFHDYRHSTKTSWSRRNIHLNYRYARRWPQLGADAPAQRRPPPGGRRCQRLQNLANW